MTDRESKIGDVIEMVRSNADNDGYLRERISQPERLAEARELVASGRWVIVDPQPQEEPSPAADTATTREGQ